MSVVNPLLVVFCYSCETISLCTDYWYIPLPSLLELYSRLGLVSHEQTSWSRFLQAECLLAT